MAKYSFQQLQQLWIQNGGNPAAAPMAAAIALAESGGNSTSVSKKNSNGTNDQGIWQISRVGIDPSLQDPNTNARIAISMSKNGSDWHPWCTAYSDGACGTKGGAYKGPSSPFWQFLTNATFGKGESAAGPNGPSAPNSKSDDQTVPGECLINLPGGICLLSASQGRALAGGGLLVAGGLIALVGVALLVTKTSSVGGAAKMLVNPVAGLPDAYKSRRLQRIGAGNVPSAKGRPERGSVKIEDLPDGPLFEDMPAA